MNLLTAKIKSIKRELTALKTSHARGLGNVKIYHRIVQVDPSGHETGASYMNVTVNFDRRFTAYPMAQIIPTMNYSGDYSMEMTGLDYSDQGYTMKAELVWIYEPGTTSFTVESTSPVDNVSYTWSR